MAGGKEKKDFKIFRARLFFFFLAFAIGKIWAGLEFGPPQKKKKNFGPFFGGIWGGGAIFEWGKTFFLLGKLGSKKIGVRGPTPQKGGRNTR